MSVINAVLAGGRAETLESAGAHRQHAIWLASYPKSGNTWVRIFIHNLLREVRRQGGRSQNINALHEMSEREALTERYARVLGKPAQEATAQEIAKARLRVQADMLRDAPGPIFIKTHHAVANVEGFATINFGVTLAARVATAVLDLVEALKRAQSYP